MDLPDKIKCQCSKYPYKTFRHLKEMLIQLEKDGYNEKVQITAWPSKLLSTFNVMEFDAVTDYVANPEQFHIPRYKDYPNVKD